MNVSIKKFLETIETELIPGGNPTTEFFQELSDYVEEHKVDITYVDKLVSDLRDMEDSRDDEERQKNELKDDLERTREELNELKARVAGLEK